MVADTIQTKIVAFLYTIFLFSCSETVIIQESDLVNGMTVQQFIRDSQYTGIIEIYYSDNQLKSLRKYSDGKKYGKHQGWWENGNQKYEYYFKNDQNVGQHMQWHSNGQLFIVKNFKNGIEEGEQKAWDQNGNLMYKYIYHKGRKYGIQGSIVCNGMNELAEAD
ncbi:MAG: hypothetical protein VYA20_00420 [Candidatus Neomarinimicrobiota bacterium]|nr:hypothetical protein [Candidatus Neomarinimicrobiota bacterium]